MQSGEVASCIVKVAGWEISHSQFGYQPFLTAQDSPDCDVLKLQQVQSYLRDSTDETNARVTSDTQQNVPVFSLYMLYLVIPLINNEKVLQKQNMGILRCW